MTPKVSVAIVTFNHENFIERAIMSALNQDTNFEYEVVVADDCSRDRTPQIVARLRREYPDKLRLLPRESNLGMRRNFVETIRSCRGRYVALLEGDDYWTAPDKLEAQAVFLDRHPACSMCFHAATSLRDDGQLALADLPPAGHPELSSLRDLLKGNFMHTCSVMFRSDPSFVFPAWFFAPTTLADWTLHVFNARRGMIGYIDRVMAVYRIHSGGAWSSRNRLMILRDSVVTLVRLAACLGVRYWLASAIGLAKLFADTLITQPVRGVIRRRHHARVRSE